MARGKLKDRLFWLLVTLSCYLYYKEVLAMGYMGFGMRKEVYSRKPKEPFAHRKTLLKDTDGVLKGAVIEEHEMPTESVLMPITRSEKVGGIVRKVLIVFFLVILAAILAVYFNGTH